MYIASLRRGGRRTQVRSRAVLAAALLLLPMMVTASVAQANPDGTTGSENGQADACEQAVKPQGHAHGLRAQCLPRGGGGAAKGDFNGDGFGDLAVGSPLEDVGNVEAAGMVHIIYGSSDGLTDVGHQFLHQDFPGVNGTPTFGDNYGHALAAGRFNNDEFSDLAVGVPGETLGGFAKAGAVNVLYGSANGLRTDTDQTWDFQDLPTSMALSRGSDVSQWGFSLAWADFNGDGPGDLAIGVPGTAQPGHGGAVVLYGSANALSILGAQEYVSGQFGDGTGQVLGAGDYDSDGFADLVVGAPDYETPLTFNPQDHGIVFVFHGDATGVFNRANSSFVQNDLEGDDQFGSSFATGDFNGDSRDDLAVGVPREDVGVNNGLVDAGSVHVYFGVAPGEDFSATAEQLVGQAAASETGDIFGFALAGGDFNFDGFDDLVVGVPGEDIGSIRNAGIVQVFPGSANGVSAGSSQVWHQDTSGIAGTAEAGDQFGFSLSAWNFGRNSLVPGFPPRALFPADLAVGIPLEDGSNLAGQAVADSGAVQVIYGSGTGLNATGNQQWTQNDLTGASDAGDRFGQAVY